jgi:integrase
MNTLKTRNTVRVFARHKNGCEFNRPGDRECQCPKYLLVYEADHKKNRMESAHTASWIEAERQAKDLRNSWDPEQIELRQLRTKKELEQISLVDAISAYLVDKESVLGDGGTVELNRVFWGDIDPATKAVRREGKLFAWIATLPLAQRPVYVQDITSQHLSNWRAAWKWNDLTKKNRWHMVRGFFNFCESRGWITDNPARKMKPLKARKGSRTVIFSDAQYETILAAVSKYDPPEFQSPEKRKHWQERIRTFVELLRWSAMDLVDAVEFRPESITGDVLRYRRQKTKELGTVKLPPHVLIALRSLPLEPGCTAERPFRTNHIGQASNTGKWSRRLRELFKLAGIVEVRTDFRVRRPHAKMLRDTAAVWWLRHGVPIHSVSKALGHSSVTTTERAYLPWVKELEDSHIAAMDRVMDLAAPKMPAGVVTLTRARGGK